MLGSFSVTHQRRGWCWEIVNWCVSAQAGLGTWTAGDLLDLKRGFGEPESPRVTSI